jgi:hypothetical protein
MSGISAGLGEEGRRPLLAIRAETQDPHRYSRTCECEFCAMASKLMAGVTVNRNGSGARCGFRSTYDRGCRCTACIAERALMTRRKNSLRLAA